MKIRRFLSLLAVSAVLAGILVIVNASATPPPLASHFPKDLIGFGEFQFTGKLQKLVTKFLDQQPKSEDEAQNLILSKIKSGALFLGGFSLGENQPSPYIAFPVTQAEFDVLTKEGTTTKETYEDIEITSGVNIALFFNDNNAYIAGSTDAAKKVIDLIKGKATDSLLTNANYTKVEQTFLAQRNLAVFFDSSVVAEFLKQQQSTAVDKETGEPVATENTVSPLGFIENFLKLINLFGFSVGETNEGYAFQASIFSDEAFMRENNISFAPGGAFVPNIYKKFPNKKPIYYSEQNNIAASLKQGDILNKILFKDLPENTQMLNQKFLFEEFEKEFGFDIENKLLNLLDKELGFAVQADNEQLLPIITVMANVSNNKDAAQTNVKELFDIFVSKLREEASPGSFSTSTVKVGNENFSKLTLDITKIEEHFDGPPIPEIVIIAGVTEDGTLIITTDKDIANKYGEGLQNHPDFSAAYAPYQDVSLIDLVYINFRHVWGLIDKFMEWGNQVGASSGHNMPLDDRRNFLEFVNNVYKVKDLLIVSKGSDYSFSLEGKLGIDEAKHETFEEWIEGLKAANTDGDGFSDFDEIYKYSTDPTKADTDGDGYSDDSEIAAGTDPRGFVQVLSDVREREWYADEVSSLQVRNVVEGYSDGTFKPGNQITRAEFTAMAMRAFKTDTENYLGVSVGMPSLSFGPAKCRFVDIPEDAWYREVVCEAYRAGFVSGYEDMTFRPSNLITRAEAIAILARMNIALQTELGRVGQTRTELPFKDVPEDAWYRMYVQIAYEKEVARGRKPNEFAPLGLMTRAEAATMIKRALDIEVEAVSNPEFEGPETGPIVPLPTLLPL